LLYRNSNEISCSVAANTKGSIKNGTNYYDAFFFDFTCLPFCEKEVLLVLPSAGHGPTYHKYKVVIDTIHVIDTDLADQLQL
jgi:hypothetical protein